MKILLSGFCLLSFLSLSAQDSLTILFAGDAMMHQKQLDNTRRGDFFDLDSYFANIEREVKAVDIAVVNFEVPLGGEPYSGYPAFSAPENFALALQKAGFDFFLLANNHCLDRRTRGLVRTIQALDSLGIRHTGTFLDCDHRHRTYPMLLRKKDFRIIMLNYTYGTNGLKVDIPRIVNYIDKDIMARDIETAKALNPDALIACMHWGIEYQSLPNKEQTSLADWLLSRGVTHVIGSHPHVVQPMELRTDTLSGQQNVVLYSLGNFISNMSTRKTDGGLLFKLELTKNSIDTSVSNCGYSLIWTARPTLSKKKNYVLYPASIPTDSLSAEERNRLKIFINDTRELFRKHNRGINEYIF